MIGPPLMLLAVLALLWLAWRAFAPVTTYYCKLTGLTQLAAVGAELHTARVGLIQGAFVPTEATVYADVTAPGTLPTYTGYAPKLTTAWGNPYMDPDGIARVDADDLLFQATDSAVPNTITGWFMYTNAGTHLLSVTMLDNPVLLDDATKGCLIDVTFVWGE